MSLINPVHVLFPLLYILTMAFTYGGHHVQLSSSRLMQRKRVNALMYRYE
jgi:2-methylcitrate dehydratase PrpD